MSAEDLHTAIRRGDLADAQRLLVAAPALCDQPTSWGELPLHAAAAAGQSAMIQLLLAGGADAAAADGARGETALLRAARALTGKAHLSCLQLLLAAAPAAAGMPNRVGLLPLHEAAGAGSVPAICLLVATAPEAATAFDPEGFTPLLRAVKGLHADAVDVLLNAAPEAALLARRVAPPPPAAAVASAQQGGGGEQQQQQQQGGGAQQQQLQMPGVPPPMQPGQAQLLQVPLPPYVAPPPPFWAHAGAQQFLAGGYPQRPAPPPPPQPLLPLELALSLAGRDPQLRMARALARVGDAALLLPLLARAQERPPPAGVTRQALAAALRPLYVDLAARLALSPQQWAQLPQPLPGLGRALPAVLGRSEAEGRQLVRRLPHGNRQRLREAVRNLALVVGSLPPGVYLPEPQRRHILAHTAI